MNAFLEFFVCFQLKNMNFFIYYLCHFYVGMIFWNKLFFVFLKLGNSSLITLKQIRVFCVNRGVFLFTFEKIKGLFAKKKIKKFKDLLEPGKMFEGFKCTKKYFNGLFGSERILQRSKCTFSLVIVIEHVNWYYHMWLYESYSPDHVFVFF